MMNAKQWTDKLMTVAGGIHDPLSVEPVVREFIKDIMQGCLEVAKTVGSKNRTEYGYSVGQPIPGRPSDGVTLSLHDTWVAAAQTIAKKIEEMRAVQ